jgi:hypothetical protein
VRAWTCIKLYNRGGPRGGVLLLSIVVYSEQRRFYVYFFIHALLGEKLRFSQVLAVFIGARRPVNYYEVAGPCVCVDLSSIVKSGPRACVEVSPFVSWGQVWGQDDCLGPGLGPSLSRWGQAGARIFERKSRLQRVWQSFTLIWG